MKRETTLMLVLLALVGLLLVQTVNADPAPATPFQSFKGNILNKTFLGIDGPDGDKSLMQCFNEEDYDDPALEKRIICWRNGTWHGIGGINRAVPVMIIVRPGMDSFRFVFSATNPKKLLVWDALWSITCLDCDPVIPTINVNTRYEYNVATGRLDEVLVENADTLAPIVRRPIKFIRNR